MKTFDKLDNRYIFTGTIVTSEALHIGSGEGNDWVDSTFVRNKDEYYIPGSSMRGALRNTIERISASLDVYTCMLAKDDTVECITVCRKTQEAFQAKVENESPDDAELVKWLTEDNRLCKTCKIFGSTYYASKIKISDLHLINDSSNKPQGIKRTGICIDRDTETASDGTLFEIEVLEKYIRFKFELIAENLEGDDFGLLSIGLQELIQGNLYLGARTSVGLGKCELENLEIKYFDNEDGSDFTLKRYLMDNQLGTKPTPTEWIQNNIKTYLSNA